MRERVKAAQKALAIRNIEIKKIISWHNFGGGINNVMKRNQS